MGCYLLFEGLILQIVMLGDFPNGLLGMTAEGAKYRFVTVIHSPEIVSGTHGPA